MLNWIDTHCHLDAPEFDASRAQVRQHARDAGVGHCVLPAVLVRNFDTVRNLAHAHGDSYALGIHPLFVAQAADEDLALLAQALAQHQGDPRLVAVGEIGLDYFEPALCESPLKERQEFFYREQLRLARRFNLPVLLHVRRSADRVLKGLRDMGHHGGIAHAFNGSQQLAQAFVDMGFKLGFGGAMTFERALQLRRLATELPLQALVLETDAPDIPPHWLYKTKQERKEGRGLEPNNPAQLPRIAAAVANLRGMDMAALAQATNNNAVQALPKLASLLAPALLV